jgi:hypothetical protein
MKNKTTQGLGNKNLLSFQKHDSLSKYCWLKSNVNSGICQYNIWINQSHYLDHFDKTNGASKESTCADNMKL